MHQKFHSLTRLGIPRYNMLIAELIKQTPENHVDLVNLKEALSALQAVALEINEAVREAERQARLNKIAGKFLDAREKTVTITAIFWDLHQQFLMLLLD